MSGFKWTSRREKVALALAHGYTIEEAAKTAKVVERTVYRWKRNLDFMMEVDRLSLMVGIANRAERLRVAMQVARQKAQEDGTFDTKRDLLDWLKFAQSETDGAKFDLASIFANLPAETENGATESGGVGTDNATPASAE